ncbi:MAG: FixH family protein [Bacteroidetes bacterium]|nr:FixH family protein [Bacteroidota bacterium]
MDQNNSHKKRPYGFWNWGTGIFITIFVSAGLMLLLVYKSSKITFDMAEKDYYAEELKYDGSMKAAQNASLLSAPLTINETHDFIVIAFPGECITNKMQGTLLLYRPSSEAQDISLPLTPDRDGKMMIGKTKLVKGVYRLKANWTMNGQPYQVEKSFFVQLM